MKGKHFKPKRIEHKCYNCESTNIENLESPAWTGQWKCNSCNHYNFAVYADFMGGALHEDVYVDETKYELQ